MKAANWKGKFGYFKLKSKLYHSCGLQIVVLWIWAFVTYIFQRRLTVRALGLWIVFYSPFSNLFPQPIINYICAVEYSSIINRVPSMNGYQQMSSIYILFLTAAVSATTRWIGYWNSKTFHHSSAYERV